MSNTTRTSVEDGRNIWPRVVPFDSIKLVLFWCLHLRITLGSSGVMVERVCQNIYRVASLLDETKSLAFGDAVEQHAMYTNVYPTMVRTSTF